MAPELEVKPAFTALQVDTSTLSPEDAAAGESPQGAVTPVGELPPRISPRRPRLKRDASGSLARAITKHAEAKAKKAKKKFAGSLSPSTEGTRTSPKRVTKRLDSTLYNNPWARAYYGTLLSVVEKSGSGSKNLQVRRVQYWFPVIEMVIQVGRTTQAVTTPLRHACYFYLRDD